MSNNTGNSVANDDPHHPHSPSYKEDRGEKDQEYDPNDRFDRLMEARAIHADEDEAFLEEFTNESLMEELERRYNHRGYMSLEDCDKVKFLFENLDRIPLAHLEWLRDNKQPLK